MKLRVSANEFGPKYSCIDDSEYDGAPDAGPQLIGQGSTEEDARADFMDQWLQREATRDTRRALAQIEVWDGVFDKLFGVKP